MSGVQVEGKKEPVCIVVMGVSGTGKSTLGTALSRALSLPYIEGDDLHPPANIAKMSRGVPLNDEDREPWLRLIRRRVEETASKQDEGESGEKLKGVIVGCSSLKRYYRDILRGLPAPTKPENGETAYTPPPESLWDASPSTLPAAASSASSSLPSAPPPNNPPSSTLTPEIKTFFAFISGPPSLLYARMEARPGHFMKASMLDSQLAVLEDPTTTGEEGVIRVSIEDPTEVQVQAVREGVRGSGVLV